MVRLVISLVLMISIVILVKVNESTKTYRPMITHGLGEKFNKASHETRLLKMSSNGLLSLPFNEEIQLLNQLSEFEMGRFLLENRGLNGFWRSYLILNAPNKNSNQLHELESWILNNAPIVRATRERFVILQKKLRQHIRNGNIVSSVPSGLMDDLLKLNLQPQHNVRFVGVEMDKDSLIHANLNIKRHSYENAIMLHRDPWDMGIRNEFDILVSNGLNIYQPSEEKLLLLYSEFYTALKPGGILITSFMTPPPEFSAASTWHNYSMESVVKQKAVFQDILRAAWHFYRTERQTRQYLNSAGFKVNEVIYDSQGMFPTIVAVKPK